MRQQNNEDVYEIDLLRLISVLWQHVVIIALTVVIAGSMGYAYARYMVTPTYQARTLLYVNNSSISLGGTAVTFSTGEFNSARSLISIYSVILKTRTTLNTVIQRGDLDYSYAQLAGMISAGSVNDTPVFAITVTSTDPEEAAHIANVIADVLPDKIMDVMDGGHVSVVDRAVVPTGRVAPSHSRYAMIGALIGLVVSCGVVLLVDMLDDIIRDEDYLLQRFEIPVLGTIPDLLSRHDAANAYAGGYETDRKSEGARSDV